MFGMQERGRGIPPREEPLYRQIARKLQAAIEEGVYNKGLLPTEGELAEQYSVSRGTIREAVRLLRAGGLVEIRRGVGTFILTESRRRLTPRQEIEVALPDIRDLGIYLGYQERKAVDTYNDGPSRENFEAMMQTQVRLTIFNTLAEPIYNVSANRPNNEHVAGKEHFLIPLIDRTFSKEFAEIEEMKRLAEEKQELSIFDIPNTLL